MSSLYRVFKETGEGVEYLTIEYFIDRFTKELIVAVDEFFDDLWKDLHLMFDKCIDQYYKYRTRRYYRHDTGIGTGTGMNLYRAINEKRGSDSFEIWFDSSDMAGYKPYKDAEENLHPVDTEFVLNNVMSGIRGLPYPMSRYGGDSMEWTASVSTNLFGNLSGTIYEIIENINSNIPNIAANYITYRVFARMGLMMKV